jgi:hypothetical protein
MIEIVVHKRTPNDIIDIVRSMRDNGMVQGKDFDFRYNQTKWDAYDFEAVSVSIPYLYFMKKSMQLGFS